MLSEALYPQSPVFTGVSDYIITPKGVPRSWTFTAPKGSMA